jgi:basic amino acid/polyamine antiporter, APA family
VWGYPVVPILFLLASLGMVANALWTDPYGTGVTLAIILVGFPLFYLWKRVSGS